MRSKRILAKNAKRAKRNRKITGYVLVETNEVVVIATLKSVNGKTGNMVQVWILNRTISPIEAVKTGKDAVVCFDCVHRGQDGKKRTCYVNISRAPQGIFRAYQRGNYAFLPVSEYSRVFGGRKIRFGAYGEPILIPVEIMKAITEVANGWTGYTHQWRKAEYQPYRGFVMASCDSASDYALAQSMGWRTFRVRGEFDAMLPREISCPASEEAGKRTTCENCLLCSGSTSNDVRKNITIIVHGVGAKNFVSVDSIKLVA